MLIKFKSWCFVLYNLAFAILHRRYTALFATEATIALICGVQRVL